MLVSFFNYLPEEGNYIYLTYGRRKCRCTRKLSQVLIKLTEFMYVHSGISDHLIPTIAFG